MPWIAWGRSLGLALLALCLAPLVDAPGPRAHAQEEQPPGGATLPPADAPRAPVAQEKPLLRYEPPSVEEVYPFEPGEGEAVAQEGEDQEVVPTPPAPATPPPKAEQPKAAEASPPAASVPSTPEPEPEYGASARVKLKKTSTPRGTHKIAMTSARDLPGAFGDPLRVLESLPGVVPLTSGLPYVYIRGAPPAAQGFIYDEIPLPQLFHAAFGPAMVHPRATGDVRLDAGIPEARYGRRLGGVLLAEGMPLTHDFGAELELRAIDAGAWLQTPIGKGEVAISGRFGYPILALSVAQAMGIVDHDTKANYANGQMRFRYPLNARDRFELVWLTAFDKLSLPGLSNDPRAGASKTHFERIETRLVRDIPRGEVGAAVRFGFDGSELGSALRVRSFTYGPRLWSQLKIKGGHTLRVGADLIGSKGEVVNGPGAIASPDGDLRISLPPIAQAPARNQGGAYVQGAFRLGEPALLQVGVRFDYWGVSSKVDVAVDPRIRLSYDLTPKLSVHGAFGTTHQPAVFLLPTAGLTDVAVDRGLMRSLQSELGAEYQLTKSTRIEVQGYFHHYDNLLLPELVTDGIVPEDPPLVSSNAYGVETFIMRDLSEQVSGWISYTLGFADADSGPVVGKFKPDYDVRHVLNAVVSWRVWRGLKLSGRFQTRSGRVVEQPNPRYTQRLPWFTRADARIGYSWRGRFADMTAYLEWLNLFVQREYTDVDCLLGRCTAKRAPVIAVPNIGVRAEF